VVLFEIAAQKSWVQRDSDFLLALVAIACVAAVVYASVYVRERNGAARPRRMRSARASAIGLLLFAVFVAVRVLVVHS